MMNIINARHSKSLIIVHTWANSQVDSVEVSFFFCFSLFFLKKKLENYEAVSCKQGRMKT